MYNLRAIAASFYAQTLRVKYTVYEHFTLAESANLKLLYLYKYAQFFLYKKFEILLCKRVGLVIFIAFLCFPTTAIE